MPALDRVCRRLGATLALAVRMSGQGKTLAAFTVRADRNGEATVSYRVPLHPAPGGQATVTYTVG